MKTLIIFFTLLIGGIILFHHSLQDGSVLRYIDTHPEAQGIPEATYYIGEGYYLFQNLDDATTYFIRVAERYPHHPLADDAFFSYMQCRDDNVSVNRAELVEGYKTYLEKFPDGKHADVAKARLDTYTSGR